MLTVPSVFWDLHLERKGECVCWLTAGLPALRAFACSPELSLTLASFCSDKVQALSYAQHTRQLISCGGDGGIVVWNMDVERQEVGVTAGWCLALHGHWAGLCSSGYAEKPLSHPFCSFLISFMIKPWNKTCLLEKKNSTIKGALIFFLPLTNWHVTFM